ncbi:MAG TPA: hypothetical protein VK272_13395 [Solirubrobacteraceae bacterium]|nr:hypothetical protein [Solirubrobacteraceae bacterium]
MSALGPPRASARRAELLERLIVALTSGAGTNGPPLALKDREPDDPTIALLDAWATAADVIGFYLDRIADEGYISSATEPGSILALAGLLGHAPEPSIAATTSVAFQLQPDPTDTAVVLQAGLLTQSVPATGEQPQTFQTTDVLTARPSWGLLAPKRSAPLTLPSAGAAALTSIVIAGTTAKPQPNQVILLHLHGASEPTPVTVAGATVDPVANQTTVALQPSVAATGPPPPSASGIDEAVDALLPSLARTPPAIPSSPNQLERRPPAVFGSAADSTTRVLSALQPAIAPTLYGALSRSTIGPQQVTGASVCQVQAAPFGAQAPPQQIFDATGKPTGSEDWPIANTQKVTLSMTAIDAGGALHNAAQALGLRNPPSWPPSFLRGHDTPTVSLAYEDATKQTSGTVEITGSGPWSSASTTAFAITADKRARVLTFGCTEGSPELKVNATLDQTGAVTFTVEDGSAPPPSYTWDPTVQTPIHAQVGIHRLSIAWSAPQGAEPGALDLTITLETPLAPADPNVLALDRLYPGILADTPVVIERTDPTGASQPPVVATVKSTDTVAACAYGMTGQVTQLTLDKAWLAPTDLYQSALRQITIQGQPAALQLRSVPVTDDVAGSSIELSSLIAGMEAGRVIAITGTRTDLPNGATAPAGELAMVLQLHTGPDAPVGDTPYTTLILAAPLAYSYERSSVKIYGNVVSARQGATITDILGSGDPAQARQTFTLSSKPLLCDPAPTASGSATTLSVTVDGVSYEQVPRLGGSAPARSFITGTDPTGRATITFASPLPAGNGNIRATYRVGDGSQGNVAANQVTQLLSRPSALLSVTNPLRATGGAGGAKPEDVRAAAPLGMRGLGRLVSVSDYADLALSWAGVAKATARSASDGRGEGILVTVAGPDPVPLDPSGTALEGLTAAVQAAADPAMRVTVLPADLYMIVLAAIVAHDPSVAWDAVADAVRAALLAAFGYANRALGRGVVEADLISAAHTVPTVRSFAVTGLALVPSGATATHLAINLPGLLSAPGAGMLAPSTAASLWGSAAPNAGTLVPDGVAFLSASVPDTLLLREATV